MDASDCPNPLDLKAYAEGRLSTAPRAAVEAHLEGCADCLGRVSLLFGLEGIPDPDEAELPPISPSAWERLEGLVPAKPATRRLRRVRPSFPMRPAWGPAWLAATALAGISVLMVFFASQRRREGPALTPGASAPSGIEEGARREESIRRAQAEEARLQAERRRAEERLAAIERERLDALVVQRRAEPEDARRKAWEELARIEAERRRAEAELEKARADQRRAEEVLARARESTKPEPTKSETLAPIAALELAQGRVHVVRRDGRVPAQAKQAILASEGIETEGPDSQAALLYPDGTRIGLAADTTVREIVDRDAARGKQLFVARGAITAEVAKQPGNQPMVLSTPHGEARVLGTTFRLIVDPASTRVEVMEGKVRLTRAQDWKSVDLAAGQYASAGTGGDLVVRREVLTWRLDLDKPQLLRPRLEQGAIVATPHGPVLKSTRTDNTFRYGAIAYWAGSEDVITLTVRKSTAIRFRYLLKEPAPIQFMIKNLTKQENFTFAFEGAAGRWIPVTVHVIDIPVVTEGKRVGCDVGDKYGRFSFLVGTPDKPAELRVDEFRVIEIER